MLSKSKIILSLLIIPAILFSQSESDFKKLKLLEGEKKIAFLDSLLDIYQYDNPAKAVVYSKEMIKVAENDADKARGYHELGYAYKSMGMFDSSITAFNEALTLYKKINSLKKTLQIYYNLGGIYSSKGDFAKAYEFHINELNILEETKDSASFAATYNKLGNVQVSLSNYKKALEYYNKAAELAQRFDQPKILSNIFNNLGVVYDYLNELDKALEFHYKSLNINLKSNNKIGISYSKLNIAEAMLKQKNYANALKFFKQAQQESEKLNLKILLVYSLRGIGNVNYSQGRYDQSVSYLMRAIEVSKEINSNFELRDCYSSLSDTYEKMNDPVSALKYYKLYADYKDSVMNTENISKVNELEAKYESSKKEKENEILKTELAYKDKLQFYHIIISIMGSSFLVLSIYWLRKIYKSNKQLKELNATKDKFFTIIAHDLKNPFSTLMGFSKMLEEDFKENTDEENTAALHALYESSKSGFKLLENLLDWSKSQTGALKFNPIKLNLRETAGNIIKLLNQTAANKNIKLESYIDNNVFVNADEEMISTTLRNIISNALKFTNSGGNVEIFAETKNGDVEIRVKDNGVGIKKEDLDKLFKLEKHHTTSGTNLEKGTGLGLIICKEFVEKNGGSIVVESMPGVGTEFKIKLPRALEDAA